jgi:selenoprotein W-related protein
VELLRKYEAEIARLSLVPSDAGKFEVEVNGDLLFSKVRTGRHAEPGEVVTLVGERLGR